MRSWTAVDVNQQKEQFGNAFIQAVTAVAGFALYKPSPDNDSVDWGIAAGGEAQTPRRPRLELQLKCTAQAPMATDTFPFELKIKNYNDLRVEKLFVPRILVVVTVPVKTEQWLELSDKQLILRHSACWLSLC